MQHIQSNIPKGQNSEDTVLHQEEDGILKAAIADGATCKDAKVNDWFLEEFSKTGGALVSQAVIDIFKQANTFPVLPSYITQQLIQHYKEIGLPDNILQQESYLKRPDCSFAGVVFDGENWYLTQVSDVTAVFTFNNGQQKVYQNERLIDDVHSEIRANYIVSQVKTLQEYNDVGNQKAREQLAILDIDILDKNIDRVKATLVLNSLSSEARTKIIESGTAHIIESIKRQQQQLRNKQVATFNVLAPNRETLDTVQNAGFSVFDGTNVIEQMEDVTVIQIPNSTNVVAVELHSDGYFDIPDTSNMTLEESLQAVEQHYKVIAEFDLYALLIPSTKSSTSNTFSPRDDRAYIKLQK